MRSIAVLPLIVCGASIALSSDHAHAATLSTTKEFAEPKPDAALVYLIREKRFQGSARTMFVYSDQTFLGTLDNNTYSYAYVPPGKHLFWLNWAKFNSQVELEAGKTYYYSVWTTFDSLDEVSGKAFIEAVEAYATPDEKEITTSAEQIEDRYGKATASAAKKSADDDSGASGLARRAAHVAAWPKVDLAPYPTLCVEPFVMADPKAESRSQEYLIDTAPARLAAFIVDDLGTAAFAEVRQESCAAPGAVVLHGRITQYKPGSEAARFIIAGAGNAQIELVVTLTDAVSGNQLSELEAKGAWGWGGSAGVAGGISNLDKNVAYEIASYLKLMRGVPLPDAP
jgi:hypothetical protein